jgi:prophage DNA circulation protein
MVDIVGLFNNLLTATIGGVPFSVIDTSTQDGRRVQQFWFPGIDDASYQDLGAQAGPVALRGLLYGEDYLAQVSLLRAVFSAAGPYTLVHPWLGKMQVILPPGQSLRVTLTSQELLIARFEVTLQPYAPSAGAGLDTLSKLETQLAAVTADAENWLAGVIQPAVGFLGAFSYLQSWLTGLSTTLTSAMAVTPSAATIQGAAQSAVAALSAPVAAITTAFGSNLANTLGLAVAAISGAATPGVPSAVASGGTTTAAAAADPTDVTNTLLAAIPGVAAGAANPSPGPALAAGMQALLVAGAVQAASNISYASQQDAIAMGATLYAAIDQVTIVAAVAAARDPLNAAPVWRDLVALKAALAADLNAAIGRLPPVVTLKTKSVISAWALAQYVSGDMPGQVYATYQDIIARNQVFHPALVPAGNVEVLDVSP